MLTVVSIVHPACVSGITEALAAAAAAAGEFAVHIVLPANPPHERSPEQIPGQSPKQSPELSPEQTPEPHTRRLPLLGGRKRLAHYRGLRRLLRELQPDVLHVHAAPCSLLALQVASLRRRHHPASGFVVECGHAVPRMPLWPFSRVRRRVLAAAGAAIARHATGLRQLAHAGFDGTGFVIAPSMAVSPCFVRSDERRAGLAVGFAGRLEPEFGVVDTLEGVAACRPRVSLVIQGIGPLRTELQDRAASLEASDRVLFVEGGAGSDGIDAATLAGLDALIVMPRASKANAFAFDRTIAAAQCHGVPVIASNVAGLGDLVGDGGWLVEPGDPARLAGLLQRIASQPDELARVTEAARREAANRTSEAAIRDSLSRAFQAAWNQRAAAPSHASRSTATIAQLHGEL